MTDREAWLEWRRGGIGASDIAAILGISPWASPWSVWADKSGLLPPEPENEAMTAGRWLERAIGPWFEDETGLVVAGEQTQCTHPKLPWSRCTMDGVVFDSTSPWSIWSPECIEEALGGLEIKVTGPGKRWETIPEHYQAQGQAQMAVTGWERVWFAVLMGRRLDIHELKRDDDDIAYMIVRAGAFWQEHVVTGNPPPTDGHDATLRALSAVYPDHDDEQAVDIDIDLVDHWGKAKTVKRDAEADERRWAAAIQAELGEAAVGLVDGRKAVSWRAQTRTTTCPHCHVRTESAPFRVLRSHAPKER